MKRIYKIFILFLVLPALIPILNAYGKVGLFKKGTMYKTAENSGGILFNDDFHASKLYCSNKILRIDNITIGSNSWDYIGFSCDPSSATMTVKIINSKQYPLKIQYTVNAPTGVDSTTKVYVGNKGSPTSVSNCWFWGYNPNTKTVTVKASHKSPVDINIIWMEENEPGTPIGWGLDPIWMYWYEGDISGGVIAIYTSRMGQFFYGVIVLATLLPPYIKGKKIEYVLIIWMLVGGAIEALIPTPVMNLSKILVILGIATILIKLFWRNR